MVMRITSILFVVFFLSELSNQLTLAFRWYFEWRSREQCPLQKCLDEWLLIAGITIVVIDGCCIIRCQNGSFIVWHFYKFVCIPPMFFHKEAQGGRLLFFFTFYGLTRSNGWHAKTFGNITMATFFFPHFSVHFWPSVFSFREKTKQNKNGQVPF